MTPDPSRNPRRSGPRLRHHLEDEFDRVLDRRHGTGRSRRRDAARRDDQLRHRARQLFEQVLLYELDEPTLQAAFLGARLEDIEVHPGAGMLTAYLAVADKEQVALCSEAMGVKLRAELALHLPRRHTPQVRIHLLSLPEDGGQE